MYLFGSHGKGSVQKYSASRASFADILYVNWQRQMEIKKSGNPMLHSQVGTNTKRSAECKI